VAKPSPTALAAQLEAVEHYLRRYVVLGDDQAAVIALWVLHTWAIDAAHSTPYLAISSAEKQSGKTRLLETLEPIVARPWFTGRVSAAVLVRKVNAETPTLLLDESDAAFSGEREYAEVLRSVLNTGYRRGGKASLCVGQGAKIEYRDFSTFGAKAIAGIGKLPDTVADRSILIRLKRRAPTETVERWRERVARPKGEAIAGALATWADHEPTIEALREAEPDLPDELDDRTQDGVEPLLAIADLAGGGWPQRAREALIGLCGERLDEPDSWGVQLLADIREAFGDAERLPTAVLLERLKADEEAPWATWGKHGLDPRGLARLLSPYGITSRNIRQPNGKILKGFACGQFTDAFTRYLPEIGAADATPATSAQTRQRTAELQPPQGGRVADREGAENPHANADVAHVADQNEEKGADRLRPRRSGR
jgi:Protein of unknown function (DUF3631)